RSLWTRLSIPSWGTAEDRFCRPQDGLTKHPIKFSQARPGRVRFNDVTPCVLSSKAPCPGFSQRHTLRRGDRDEFLGRLVGQAAASNRSRAAREVVFRGA